MIGGVNLPDLNDVVNTEEIMLDTLAIMPSQQSMSAPEGGPVTT